MRVGTTIRAAGCLLFAMLSQAAADPGSAQLAGRSVLAIEGCGRDRAMFLATVDVDAGGTWSAQESEGATFSGTWTPKGRSGRKVEMAFDAGTAAGFLDVLLGDITELCDLTTPISVTSARMKICRLILNRKRTRVTLVLDYAIKGRADRRSGTASYHVRAKGAWTAAGGAVATR
jgi:hypothetical protein